MEMRVYGEMRNGKPHMFLLTSSKEIEPNDIIHLEGGYHRVISDGNKMQVVKLNPQPKEIEICLSLSK